LKKYYDSIDDLVGNTPLLKLNNLKKYLNLKSNIYVKLEYYNIGGSIKTRIAKNMIDKLEEEGKLKEGSTIIEATSGNTGIGLSLIAASRGYKAIIIMPEGVTIERVKLLKSYGAKVYLTPKEEAMQGPKDLALKLNSEIKNSEIVNQFENPNNPLMHYMTTAPEIYKALGKKITHFVSAAGTGGTLGGCAKYLKEKNKKIKIIGVEPEGTEKLKDGEWKPHKIEGIGGAIRNKNLDFSLIDSIYECKDEDAYYYARLLPQIEGISIGISAGAAISGAIDIAKNSDKGNNIVVIIPDSGDHYLSGDLFQVDVNLLKRSSK
jgi:cysteine synthase A